MNRNIRKMIKRDAKQALSGNWLTAIIIGFILLLISSTGPATWNHGGMQSNFSVSGNGFSFLSILLAAPLTMGAVRWYLSMLRREEPMIEQVFSWFTKERYLPSLMVRLFFIMVRFIETIAGILLVGISMIPLFVIGRFSFFSQGFWENRYRFMPFDNPYDFFRFPGIAKPVFLCLGLSFLIVLAVLLFAEWFITRYSAIPNIVSDNPKIGIGTAIRQSCDVMRGNGWKMIRFYLSFIGWALLVPVTLGLILIYLIPYFTASKSLYIEYFRDMYAKSVSGGQDNQPPQNSLGEDMRKEEQGPVDPIE